MARANAVLDRPSGTMNSSRSISPGWMGRSFRAMTNASVVIDDFNIEGITIMPAETNAKLIVDANAVLASTVAFERLQPMARRNTRKVVCRRRVQLHQFAPCH